MKEQIYIPETEIEMHYFKKMQLLENEIKQLKIDSGKKESYIQELLHTVKALNGTIKQKDKLIKKYTLLLSEPESSICNKNMVRKLKATIAQRDQAIYNLLNNNNGKEI